MQFKDGNKEYEIEYSHVINSNCHDYAVCILKINSPVFVETTVDIGDIRHEHGLIGLRFEKYSPVAKAVKSKSPVFFPLTEEAVQFIKDLQNEKIEELSQAAQKDPEKWFWAVGGDTHQIYLTPDTETGTTYREDLKKVEETLEKKLMWISNPLDAVSKKIDRKTGLYTETGWFEVSHADIMRIYNEIVAEKEAKKTEKEAKTTAIFEKAKQTGEKQIIETYSVECSDPDEECDTDIVTIYAMPDGTTKTTQNHTW